MDDANTVAALRLEVARLRTLLGRAMMLEREWRIRALLGHFPSEPEAPAPPRQAGGSRQRAGRRKPQWRDGIKSG